MSKLAIVIPAFKNIYFEQTLESIAKQTCKNFTLYIGDDCSPTDLQSIVDSYQGQIRIKYIRFNENLGGKDLVAHWERCIDLIEDEEWVWLFSDDDIMESNCVKNFYDAVFYYEHFDLFHFNILKISGGNKIIGNMSFPDVVTIEEFLRARIQDNAESYVVEYIFRKSHFFEVGRFQNFDLAWGSDDATWIKLGKKNGIKNIENAKVYWRASRHNISMNNSDGKILKRKLYARIEYIKWLYKLRCKNEIQIQFNELQKILERWFLISIKESIKLLSFKDISDILTTFYLEIEMPEPISGKIKFIYLYKIYRMFVEITKKIVFWDSFIQIPVSLVRINCMIRNFH